jgi:hypothetical protein
VIACLDFASFGECFVAFLETGAAFFDVDRLAETLRAGFDALRAGRVLRAAEFLFEELFFFFGLALT